MKRVSARVLNLNSFQNRVPTGNRQTSGFDASIHVPWGSDIHRDLIAPSVHRGYCGENWMRPGVMDLAFQSAYRPVSRRRAGGHVPGGAPAATI